MHEVLTEEEKQKVLINEKYLEDKDNDYIYFSISFVISIIFCCVIYFLFLS